MIRTTTINPVSVADCYGATTNSSGCNKHEYAGDRRCDRDVEPTAGMIDIHQQVAHLGQRFATRQRPQQSAVTIIDICRRHGNANSFMSD
jgi:hypothetical protein